MSTSAFLNLGTVGILDRPFIGKGGWREAVQGTVKCLGKSLVFAHLVSAIYPICSNPKCFQTLSNVLWEQNYSQLRTTGLYIGGTSVQSLIMGKKFNQHLLQI